MISKNIDIFLPTLIAGALATAIWLDIRLISVLVISGAMIGTFAYIGNRISIVLAIVSANLLILAVIIDQNFTIPSSLVGVESLLKISILNILFCSGIFLGIFAFAFLDKTTRNYILTLVVSIYLFFLLLRFSNLSTALIYQQYLLTIVGIMTIFLVAKITTTTSHIEVGYLIVVANLLVSSTLSYNITMMVLFFLTNFILLIGVLVLARDLDGKLPKLALLIVYISLVGIIPNFTMMAKNELSSSFFLIVLMQSSVVVHLIRLGRELWVE